VNSFGKLCFSAIKPSASVWHGLLGHPSLKTVSRVLRDHDLPFVPNNSPAHVCDACMQGKSRQLPFSKFVSISKAPLHLVFFHVWVLPPLLLEIIVIMFVFLMILASLLEFTCLNINLKSLRSFMISRLMSNVSLTERS
jgi:hypothetical protein